jgi:hypothetical protein
MERSDEQFIALDDVELLDLFGAGPIECDVADGYQCYEAIDRRAVVLRFSFKLYERSVQTELRLNTQIIARTSVEGARSMRRDGSTLFCEFQSRDTKSTVTIELGQ